MTSLLFGISTAALLSTTTFLIILFRISPLSAPFQAVPVFFMSLFLSISTVSALLFVGIRYWLIKKEGLNPLLSVSLREGLFLGSATVIALLFHLFRLLNWWIGVLIYVIFLLIELALWEDKKE